jgi:Holliday junction resolvase-like predicted endonuclease
MSISKHDQLVDIIADEMRSRGYTEIFKHTEYIRRKSGEIDLYVVKGKYVFCFEMKTNDCERGYNKAVDQLRRAEKYYFRKYQRVFKFYVYDYKNPKVRKII